MKHFFPILTFVCLLLSGCSTKGSGDEAGGIPLGNAISYEAFNEWAQTCPIGKYQIATYHYRADGKDLWGKQVEMNFVKYYQFRIDQEEFGYYEYSEDEDEYYLNSDIFVQNMAKSLNATQAPSNEKIEKLEFFDNHVVHTCVSQEETINSKTIYQDLYYEGAVSVHWANAYYQYDDDGYLQKTYMTVKETLIYPSGSKKSNKTASYKSTVVMSY